MLENEIRTPDPTPDRPAEGTAEMPSLMRMSPGHARLLVDGAPFLALGGELHNSSSSDPEYMRPVWDRLRGSGFNSVIASVGWDQVEPVEGALDFSVVDSLLAGARSAGLRLILIWFGAFKNAGSSYAPSWVRADRSRFPRAVPAEKRVPTPFSYSGSMSRPVLSVFSDQLREADSAAYRALMAHLAGTDREHTVILMQVENEVGLLGSARDHSAPASKAWHADVPEELRRVLREQPDAFSPTVRQALLPAADSGGSWAELFGDGDPVVDEAFMSWGFASYVGAVAAAGKEELALPAYANAWLGPQAPGDLPGTYPSGGPTAAMLGVWRAAAPSLDFLAPDIYVPDSRAVMEQYAVPGNPLFIPEARFRAGDAFLAIGQYGGIGYQVFGVEDGRSGSQFSKASRAILASTDAIVEAQRSGSVFAFALGPDDDSASAELNGITVTVRNAPKLFATMLLDVGVVLPPPAELPNETEDAAHGITPGDNRVFGLIAALPDGSFLLVGQGAIVDFSTEGADLEMDWVHEQRLVDGKWKDGRILNGDERLAIVPRDRIGAARLGLLRLDAADEATRAGR